MTQTKPSTTVASPTMPLCFCIEVGQRFNRHVDQSFPPLSYRGRLSLRPEFGDPGHVGWNLVVLVVMAYLSRGIGRGLGLDGGPRSGRVDEVGDSVPEAHFENRGGGGEKKVAVVLSVGC